MTLVRSDCEDFEGEQRKALTEGLGASSWGITASHPALKDPLIWERGRFGA